MLKRDEARKQLSLGIEKRIRPEIEKALEICYLDSGVDGHTILDAEKLVEILKKEDEVLLIQKINTAFEMEDVETLEELIAKFK